MRSAKADKKVRTDLMKYEVDPKTGEVYVENEKQTRIFLKDYESNVMLPAYPWSIGVDVLFCMRNKTSNPMYTRAITVRRTA